MKKKIYLVAVVIAVGMMLTTSSCKGHKREAAEVDETKEHVDTIKTIEEQVPPTETKAANEETDAEAIDGYPSTYEQPKGRVLDVLKDYNAHMSDYNTTETILLDCLPTKVTISSYPSSGMQRQAVCRSIGIALISSRACIFSFALSPRLKPISDTLKFSSTQFP